MSEGMEEVVRRKPGRPPRGDRAELRPTSTSLRSSEEFGEFREFEDHTILPNVADTKEWHYCWIRATVNGVMDGKNLNRHINGNVRYEPVPASEMPGLVHFRATNAAGINGDVIQVDDVVLMRCRQEIHQRQMRYYDHQASVKSQDLKTKTQASMKDQRVRVTYTDEESTFQEGGDE